MRAAFGKCHSQFLSIIIVWRCHLISADYPLAKPFHSMMAIFSPITKSLEQNHLIQMLWKWLKQWNNFKCSKFKIVSCIRTWNIEHLLGFVDTVDMFRYRGHHSRKYKHDVLYLQHAFHLCLSVEMVSTALLSFIFGYHCRCQRSILIERDRKYLIQLITRTHRMY